jgi:hypothetical protein
LISKKVAREKIRVKSPGAKRWKKISALFDGDSPHEHVNPELLRKLNIEINRFSGTAILHVKVLGEEYSWSFRASDLDWRELRADVIFGREFMEMQGVILKPTPKGIRVEYAPGYPREPVI